MTERLMTFHFIQWKLHKIWLAHSLVWEQ